MYKILIINSGSSSIKYQLIEMPSEIVVVKGMVDAIGTEHSLFTLNSHHHTIQEKNVFSNHEEGIQYIIAALKKYNIIDHYSQIDGCGHRVAHGGEKFHHSVVIDNEVEDEIGRLGTLAPLHNPMNLLGYQILKEILPNAKHVATFDTSFHQTLEKPSYIYAIPYHYYTQDHIRKYGFHGTSCQYISLRAKEIFGCSRTKKMIICHLGNGASITAIKNGKSIDTSMGLTPLGGVMMGTRCGNIDPSIIEYISQLKGKTVTDVLSELNYQSGLLGLSLQSYDMRVLIEEKRKGNMQAKLAIDVYVKRIIDYIGSYYFQLGGLDTLVFTAGVGENSSEIKNLILDKIKDVLQIDVSQNKEIHEDYEILSSSTSKVIACVIKTNEEMMIARETYQYLK